MMEKLGQRELSATVIERNINMVEQMQQHTFSEASRKIKEGAQEFKDAVTEIATNTRSEYCDQTTDMVKEHPYKSLLIAFGAGAVFSLLFLRRK